MLDLQYSISPDIGDDALNTLFAAAWDDHQQQSYSPIHSRSLLYVCAFDGTVLVGYVNVAWDGGVHGFILDPTVHPAYRRRGIATRMIALAVERARECGLEWLHVDYEPHLEPLYRACGFRHSEAGVMRLR